MTEQPTVKEPTTEPTQTQESAMDDIAAKLKELDIDTPERLDNMAKASSEAGRLANMVGELKQQNEQLTNQMNELSRRNTPSQDYEYGEPTIDINAAIDRGVTAAIDRYAKTQQENQRKATEAYYKDMGRIQNDKRYKVLSDKFQTHVNNPTVQMRLQRGDTNIVDEYYRIKDAYIDILEENYVNKVDKATQPVTPPHMETSEHTTVPSEERNPSDKSEMKKKVDPSKGWEGTDENVKDLFSGMFSENDPFMKTSF
jgi:hypothetical protein